MPTQVHLSPAIDIPTLRKDGFEDEVLGLVAQRYTEYDLDGLASHTKKPAQIKSWDYWKKRAQKMEIANDGTFAAPVWESDPRAKNSLMIRHYASGGTVIERANEGRYPSSNIRLGDEIRFSSILPCRPLLRQIQGWVVISKESDAMLIVRDESCPACALDVFNRFNLWRVLWYLDNVDFVCDDRLPKGLGLAPDQFSASDFFWGLLGWADLPEKNSRADFFDARPRIGSEACLLLGWLSSSKPPGFFRELMQIAITPDYPEEICAGREDWLRILARVCARSVLLRRQVSGGDERADRHKDSGGS